MLPLMEKLCVQHLLPRGLQSSWGREANMHTCDPCGTSYDCGAWGQCLEGPSWPPGGPASRTLWWGIGVACLLAQAIQARPLGSPAGMAGGIRVASVGKTS